MGLFVSWNTAITEEPVWFLRTFVLLLTSPPLQTQKNLHSAAIFLDQSPSWNFCVDGLYMSVLTDALQPPFCTKIYLIICILYSPSLQVNDISSFFCRLQKNMVRFPFHLLSISVQIILLLLLSFSSLLLSSIRNIFNWGNRNC